MKYSITWPEELRCLCIRENWFTSGNCQQYEKLFEMNAEGSPLTDIALVIWICSDGVSKTEIIRKLHQARMEYAVAHDIAKFSEKEGA